MKSKVQSQMSNDFHYLIKMINYSIFMALPAARAIRCNLCCQTLYTALRVKFGSGNKGFPLLSLTQTNLVRLWTFNIRHNPTICHFLRIGILFD